MTRKVGRPHWTRRLFEHRLKLYLLIGTPGGDGRRRRRVHGPRDGDLAHRPPALGIGPFCAKRNTPLDGEPFAGIGVVDARLDRQRRGPQGRGDVRATARDGAWVEYALAQGREAEGAAVVSAVAAGGSFQAYKQAFAGLAKKAPTRALKVATA